MIKHAYIHIPFCYKICNYCDFCKMLYYEKWVDDYLKALEQEVDANYQNDVLNTIYIGGGTPSCLTIKQLRKLLKIIEKFKTSSNLEFTFECNLDDLTEEKLKLLKDNQVNRISVGIQTFNPKHQQLINRHLNYHEAKEKINLIKKYFTNINVDLMYGFKDQTLEELEIDLKQFMTLDISHISTYSLMIEPHTKLYIDNLETIDEELDYQMFKLINRILIANNFEHYEISNYCLKNKQSNHNLSYWNNENYYGFGLGASGYIDNIRYDNTRNLNKYLKGNYCYAKEFLNEKKTIENEMILGLRKTKGINEQEFIQKYGKKIEDVFDINKLIEEEKLIKSNHYLFINYDYLYVSNDILINFIE